MTPSAHPIDPETVMALLDGELPAAEAASVRAHVAGCAECARLSGDLALVSSPLAAWKVEPVPATLRAPWVAIGWGHRLRGWWRPLAPRRAWALAAAGAVLVVLVGLGAARQVWRQHAVAVGVPSPAAETLTLGRAVEGPFVAELSGQVAAERLVTDRLVVTRVTLSLVTRDFDTARATLDRVVGEAGGFVGEISIQGSTETSRFLRGTIRVPGNALDRTLAALRGLGQVQEESRRSDDVTEGVRDVEARLANARAAEQRIVEILARRAGSLADVLAAERELARIRGEIERLEADRQNVMRQVQYASITLQIRELRPESLQVGSQPLIWRVRDAFVRGARGTAAGLVGTLLIIVGILPTLAVLAVVTVPIVAVVRRRRARARAE
jgi:hypothetical protein